MNGKTFETFEVKSSPVSFFGRNIELLKEISKKQDKQIELLEQLVSILGGNMDDGR